MEVLETRLLDPEAIERRSLALGRRAREQHLLSLASRNTASRAARKALLSAAHAVGGAFIAPPRLTASVEELVVSGARRRTTGGRP